MSTLPAVAVCGLVSALSTTALAQTSPAPAGTTASPEVLVTPYPASFFLEQGAVTALDMVQSLPGFAFRDTDGSRGYSGAAGNVLIDGRRPSSKTTQLRSLLRQIPASLVERVELVRAGAPGVDMQGLPLVANIVRRKGASGTLALEGLAKIYTNGEAGSTLRTEGSRRDGDSFFEGAAEVRRERNDEEAGDGPISRTDATGAPVSAGRYVADYWTERTQASAAYERQLAKGLLRTNLSLAHRNDGKRDLTNQTSVSGLASRETVDNERRVDTLGFGADYDGQLGASSGFQILALQTLEQDDNESNRQTATLRQLSDAGARSGESILRGTLRWRAGRSATLEAGAEAAFNFLNARSALTLNGASVSLPAANIKVSEWRSEAFSTLILQAGKDLSLNMGLRVETSRIQTRGDVINRNEFTFIKPRLQATWAARPSSRLRVGVEREVGQLDFDDFAASTEFANDTVSAGNPDLEPERSWVYEAAVEQDLPGSGTLTLGYKHYAIEQVIDVVAVQGFAAPGNIGSGRRGELAASASLPLMLQGLEMGRVQFTGTWRHSTVKDPLTGAGRQISEEKPFEGELVYTRDFPSLRGTLGVRGELTSRDTAYRLDQTIAERRGDLWRVYWDWRTTPRLLLRLQVENLAARDLLRERVIYQGLRSAGVVATRERRSAQFDPFLTFRARWKF